MDTERIRELAFEVRELNSKIGKIQSDLQSEIQRLDFQVRTLKTEALTKMQAIVAVYLTFYIIFLIAAVRH